MSNFSFTLLVLSGKFGQPRYVKILSSTSVPPPRYLRPPNSQAQGNGGPLPRIVHLQHIGGAFQSWDLAVDAEFNRGRPIQLLDETIECLRDAVKARPPDSYDAVYSLANRLSTRFTKTHSNDDYEEATALMERILDPNRPGDCPDSNSEVILGTSVDERPRLQIINALAMQASSASEKLEEANSYISQVVDLSSSESLEKSGELFFFESDEFSILKNCSQLLLQGPDVKGYLNHLAKWYRSKFHRINDISFALLPCATSSTLRLFQVVVFHRNFHLT